MGLAKPIWIDVENGGISNNSSVVVVVVVLQ
jgi:hypothetical protein